MLGALLCILSVTSCGAGGMQQMMGGLPSDHRDIRKVVGASTHIFVGRLIAVVGNEGVRVPGGRILPRTQFSVEALENIKDELSGTVIVVQNGRLADDGVIVALEEDALLEVGKTYLLATEYLPDDTWYRIVAHGYGNIEVEDAEKRSREVVRFRSAIEHQILPSSREFWQSGPVPEEFKLQNASER